jgi:hypothetical protein
MAILLSDNLQNNSPKPLDAKYLNGVTPWASVAAANAGIALTERSIGLTVNINNVEYWYAAGITNSDLVIKSGGSGSLPIVRYVYLVQDASDATKMGGTLNNVYTTFQSAYNAANVLQVSLGGSNIVVVQVGNITAAAAGDLTLTSNYNRFVQFSGISIVSSVLGNIIATNSSGNGYTVGNGTLQPVFFTNIRIGNINTNATGISGNSGNVSLRVNSVQVGNIDTSITNVTNTTGNGGSFTYNVNTNNFAVFGNITTSSQGSLSSAGSVSISSSNFVFSNITTSNGNQGGVISIDASSGRFLGTSITINTTSTVSANILTLRNGNVNNINVTSDKNINITNCTLISATFSNSIIQNTLNIVSSIISGVLTTNPLTKSIIKLSSLSNIINLGDDSFIVNTVVDFQNTVTPAINGIGSNCTIVNSSILGGSLSIDNSTPQIVQISGVSSTPLIYIQNTIGVNITLA